MKKIVFFMLAIFMGAVLNAADILLPAAEKSGGMALSEALNIRRSIRKYDEKAVTLQQLSNVLWSANGITCPDGKRTAPSALNRQEVLIFVTMKEGTFFYDPAAHMLKYISGEDLRRQAGRYPAPGYIILAVDADRQPRELFAALDTGYVSQNIYLAATAQQLGTCAMGSIADRDVLRKKVLSGRQKIMLVHPLGIPAK